MKLDMTSPHWNDKASHNPDELRIYLEEEDYIRAYSKHTDLRVRRDGPALAIGGDWEGHGPLQLKFMQDRGMTPQSRLLDLGCGTGRFARHAVPFLGHGNYTGLDISPEALAYAQGLARREGWAEKAPTFIRGDGTLAAVKDLSFDFVWAHSVFTHLPDDRIRAVLQDLSGMDFEVFYFTYKRRAEPTRTGLKQFGYPPQYFVGAAAQAGLHCEEFDTHWPQGQVTMRAWK